MDFGIYPPEINSGRMYTGPGPGPMLAAAQAWETVADELYTTISGYRSVVSGLTEGPWLGPSSAAMSAAAGSYVGWLTATAAQAEQAGAQAWTAVAAYEAAFASTVPPPEIAANRGLLAALVVTNFLGQNTPAIAATEALYAEMWAQDVLAMYNYAGSSAAAVVLTPFSSPHQNTDQGETADAYGAMSVVPQALSAMAIPAQAELLDLLATLGALLIIGPSDATTLFGVLPADVLSTIVDFPIAAFTTVSGVGDDHTFSGWNGKEAWPGTEPAPVQPFVTPLPGLPAGGIPAPAMSAGFGEASRVGALTVPSGWTEIAAAAAEVRPAALATPLASANAVAGSAAEFDVANTLNQMGAGAMGGQSTAGPPAAGDVQKNGRAARLTGCTAAAPAEDVEVLPAPRTVMTGVAAAIREITVERAAGRLSEREYTEQKKSLLEISFGQ